MLSMPCVCHAFASVHCCLVVTYWERADLLALVCDVCCDFVTFPFNLLCFHWTTLMCVVVFLLECVKYLYTNAVS